MFSDADRQILISDSQSTPQKHLKTKIYIPFL